MCISFLLFKIWLFSLLHLQEIVEGLCFYFGWSVCLCVYVCVCLWTKFQSNRCSDLDVIFAKWLLTALAQTFIFRICIWSKILKIWKHLIFIVSRKGAFLGVCKQAHGPPLFLYIFQTIWPKYWKKDNFFFIFQFVMKSASGVFNVLNWENLRNKYVNNKSWVSLYSFCVTWFSLDTCQWLGK